MIDITRCEASDCKVYRKFGAGIRTPATDNGLMRDTLLCPMDRPVVDASNVGLFVLPKKIRAEIVRKKMTFEQLKKEMPAIDKHPYEKNQ